MEPTNITVRILEEIRDSVQEVRDSVQEVRDSVRDVRQELENVEDKLGRRIDQTNARVDILTDRVTNFELRVSTELHAVSSTMLDIKVMLDDRLDLRGRVQKCERRIENLEDHTGLKK